MVVAYVRFFFAYIKKDLLVRETFMEKVSGLPGIFVFFFLYFSLNPFDVERIYFLYWISAVYICFTLLVL